MRKNVHPGRVEPDEEWLVCLRISVDELLGRTEKFLVNCRHSFDGQGTGVFYPLSAIGIGPGMDDAARTIFFLELRVLRIKIAFGLFLGVAVIKVSKEFIEAVIGRQMLIVIPEMIFSELARGVALGFQNVRDSRHPIRDAMWVAGHPNR